MGNIHANTPKHIYHGYSRTLTPNARQRIARMVRDERRYAPRWAVKSSIRALVTLALETYANNGIDR